jgi:hypothetical protein
LLRRESGNENKSARGGYVFQEAEGGERKLTILTTGSELDPLNARFLAHINSSPTKERLTERKSLAGRSIEYCNALVRLRCSATSMSAPDGT